MNDESLKQLLKENLEELPSGNFNHRVLSKLPVKKEANWKFMPMDEPLIFGFAFSGLLLLAGLFLFGGPALSGSIFLLIAVLALVPVFIILSNRITQRKISHTQFTG